MPNDFEIEGLEGTVDDDAVLSLHAGVFTQRLINRVVSRAAADCFTEISTANKLRHLWEHFLVNVPKLTPIEGPCDTQGRQDSLERIQSPRTKPQQEEMGISDIPVRARESSLQSSDGEQPDVQETLRSAANSIVPECLTDRRSNTHDMTCTSHNGSRKGPFQSKLLQHFGRPARFKPPPSLPSSSTSPSNATFNSKGAGEWLSKYFDGSSASGDSHESLRRQRNPIHVKLAGTRRYRKRSRCKIDDHRADDENQDDIDGGEDFDGDADQDGSYDPGQVFRSSSSYRRTDVQQHFTSSAVSPSLNISGPYRSALLVGMLMRVRVANQQFYSEDHNYSIPLSRSLRSESGQGQGRLSFSSQLSQVPLDHNTRPRCWREGRIIRISPLAAAGSRGKHKPAVHHFVAHHGTASGAGDDGSRNLLRIRFVGGDEVEVPYPHSDVCIVHDLRSPAIVNGTVETRGGWSSGSCSGSGDVRALTFNASGSRTIPSESFRDGASAAAAGTTARTAAGTTAVSAMSLLLSGLSDDEDDEDGSDNDSYNDLVDARMVDAYGEDRFANRNGWDEGISGRNNNNNIISGSGGERRLTERGTDKGTGKVVCELVSGEYVSQACLEEMEAYFAALNAGHRSTSLPSTISVSGVHDTSMLPKDQHEAAAPTKRTNTRKRKWKSVSADNEEAKPKECGGGVAGSKIFVGNDVDKAADPIAKSIDETFRSASGWNCPRGTETPVKLTDLEDPTAPDSPPDIQIIGKLGKMHRTDSTWTISLFNVYISRPTQPTGPTGPMGPSRYPPATHRSRADVDADGALAAADDDRTADAVVEAANTGENHNNNMNLHNNNKNNKNKNNSIESRKIGSDGNRGSDGCCVNSHGNVDIDISCNSHTRRGGLGEREEKGIEMARGAVENIDAASIAAASAAAAAATHPIGRGPGGCTSGVASSEDSTGIGRGGDMIVPTCVITIDPDGISISHR